MGRIVVFGSLNMDLVINVPNLPEPGATVMGDRLLMFTGGKGANQAVAAAHMGAEVSMVGRVGSDGFGDRLIAELKAAGVNADGVVKDPDQPTGSALIVVDAKGRNQIAVAPAANQKVGREDLERLVPLLSEDTLLLLQMEIPAVAVQQAILLARQRGSRVLLNAAPAANVTSAMLKDLDLLLMNRDEAGQVLGLPVVSMGGARRAILRGHQMGVGSIIVTVGSSGSILCTAEGVQDIPPFPVKTVDATGAGDAYAGALAAALSRGLELPEAAKIASAAGAAATLRQGAQSSLPTAGELKQMFGVGWG